jgi:hypothetical protein
MKILSIDVGIKNLALCLLDKSSDHYTITKWEVVNISEKDSVTCGFVDKKGLCNNPAKFKKDSKCFCLKHSKKQEYQVPTSELSSSYINKQKLLKLYDLAAKYNIKYEVPIKKVDLISLINNHVHTNCFEPVHATNASKIDLINIGMNIKSKLDELFKDETMIDYVIIENQISPIANRMKTVQGMIAQYFIMSDVAVDRIEFVSASNKLKDCDEKEKVNYKDRKKLGIKKCLELLSTNNGFNNKLDYFDSHKKKDDLADSFLQGIWFINNREL